MPPGSTRVLLRLTAHAGGTLVELEHHGLTPSEATKQAGREDPIVIVNASAPCTCDRRVQRAIELGRIQRETLVLAKHSRREVAARVRDMESLHATAALFRSHPEYAAPLALAESIREVVATGVPGILR